MKHTMKFFLVVNDRAAIHMGRTASWLVEDGFVLYPNDIIPLVQDGVGCLATVRVIASEHDDASTKVFFEFVDSASSTDPERLAAYYAAYLLWKSDNGLGETPLASELLPLGTHVFLMELGGQAIEIKGLNPTTADGTRFDYVGLPVPFCDGTAVYFQHDEIAAVSAVGDHLVISNKIYGEPVGCCPASDLKNAMEGLPSGNYSARQIPKEACPICNMNQE